MKAQRIGPIRRSRREDAGERIARMGSRVDLGGRHVAWMQGGQPRVVSGFTIAQGRIVGMEILADPEHLRAMELVVLAAMRVASREEVRNLPSHHKCTPKAVAVQDCFLSDKTPIIASACRNASIVGGAVLANPGARPDRPAPLPLSSLVR